MRLTTPGPGAASPANPPPGNPPPGNPRIDRRRRWLTVGVGLASVALVPWSVYLAFTLPVHYDAHRWRGTWVGFDIVMALCLAATAVLAARRRLAFVVTATAAGTMLLVDAWFDVRSSVGADHVAALVAAVLLELPGGVLLLLGASRVVRRLDAGLRRRGLTWGDLLTDDPAADPID